MPIYALCLDMHTPYTPAVDRNTPSYEKQPQSIYCVATSIYWLVRYDSLYIRSQGKRRAEFPGS